MTTYAAVWLDPTTKAPERTGPGWDRPERLPLHHRNRALAAVVHALRLYPGAAGQILAAEIRTYAEMGFLARADAPVARLIDELMGQPLPPAA